jgi:hypothetical protein
MFLKDIEKINMFIRNKSKKGKKNKSKTLKIKGG